MTKSNNADVFKIQHNMMKLTAGWPIENAPTSYKIKAVINYGISLILATTMLMEAYADRTDFAKLSEILYIMITVIAYCIKHGSIFLQRKTFVYMIKLLTDPIFLSYPHDLDYLMVRRIHVSQLLANSYRLLCLTYLILMTLSPFFDNKPLPFPFPYDLGRYRPLMFIFQVIAIGINAWNNSCLDSLTACLMGLGATHLEILSNKITLLSDEHLGLVKRYRNEFSKEIDEEIDRSLRQCIKHHMAIIDFIESIDGAFSFAILAQFCGSVIIICNTLFHVVLVPVGSSQFFMLFNYLAIMISQLFMYCWFGNEVVWKSVRIGEACYIFNWYNCGNKVRKQLFNVMERSKRPLKITAFKFSSLSLAAFTSIMQWSYSYFALLMKLYKKQPESV